MKTIMKFISHEISIPEAESTCISSKNPDPSRSSRIDGRNIPSEKNRNGELINPFLRTYLDFRAHGSCHGHEF